MRLVGDDDDVAAIGEHGHLRLALPQPELVDQREDVAVVGAQQLAQVGGGVGVDVRLAADRAGVDERAVELIVELLAVGDHDERPPAGDEAEHLLREPQHREALACALRVPEDAELLIARRANPLERLHRRVYAEVLVVTRERLDEAAGLLAVRDEALDEIEQARRLARSPNRGLELDAATRSLSSIHFHSPNCSHGENVAPSLAAEPFERITNAFGQKSCGIVSR